jgi:hypothetical protein
MLDRDRLLATFAATLCASTAVNAQNDAPLDRTPVDCITVSRIDRTDIIDDRTIIFFMRGGKLIYRNYLPHTCPRLAIEDRFGYQTTTARVCRVDTIAVLPRVGIPTYCQLGEFHPITREDVEELRAVRESGRSGDAIESKPAEPAGETAPADDDRAAPENTEPAQE